MNDKEFKKYHALHCIYEKSEIICDPLEYIVRKKNLINDIAEWLLQPYYDELKKREEEK